MANEGKCPFTRTTRGYSNRDWWPNQVDIQILHQHTSRSSPLRPTTAQWHAPINPFQQHRKLGCRQRDRSISGLHEAPPTEFEDRRGPDDQQRPQLSIAALRDGAEAFFPAAGIGSWRQSESSREIPGCLEPLWIGQVKINYAAWDAHSPFGGYKQSGNGREYADWGIHEFLELKSMIGYGAA